MTENKDNRIQLRISKADKEKIIEYCKEHNLKISEFVRMACARIFGSEG